MYMAIDTMVQATMKLPRSLCAGGPAPTLYLPVSREYGVTWTESFHHSISDALNPGPWHFATMMMMMMMMFLLLWLLVVVVVMVVVVVVVVAVAVAVAVAIVVVVVVVVDGYGAHGDSHAGGGGDGGGCAIAEPAHAISIVRGPLHPVSVTRLFVVFVLRMSSRMFGVGWSTLDGRAAQVTNTLTYPLSLRHRLAVRAIAQAGIPRVAFERRKMAVAQGYSAHLEFDAMLSAFELISLI